MAKTRITEKSLENLNKRVQFSSTHQPKPENRLAGIRKFHNFKKAMELLGGKLHTIINIDSEEIELSYEGKVAFEMLKNAAEGDVKAAEFLAKVNGWFAPVKVENTDTVEIEIKGEKHENNT